MTFSVEGDEVMINEATIVATDIEASNGVIRVIDAVILPLDTWSPGVGRQRRLAYSGHQLEMPAWAKCPGSPLCVSTFSGFLGIIGDTPPWLVWMRGSSVPHLGRRSLAVCKGGDATRNHGGSVHPVAKATPRGGNAKLGRAT